MKITEAKKQFIEDWIAPGSERSATIQLNKLLESYAKEVSVKFVFDHTSEDTKEIIGNEFDEWYDKIKTKQQ